ncbi:MAG: hypothetical protein PHV32_18620 [Eubacteriales bacterium]|nr:hypothetical protein [Eubacteriales bacterium]
MAKRREKKVIVRYTGTETAEQLLFKLLKEQARKQLSGVKNVGARVENVRAKGK